MESYFNENQYPDEAKREEIANACNAVIQKPGKAVSAPGSGLRSDQHLGPQSLTHPGGALGSVPTILLWMVIALSCSHCTSEGVITLLQIRLYVGKFQ